MKQIDDGPVEWIELCPTTSPVSDIMAVNVQTLDKLDIYHLPLLSPSLQPHCYKQFKVQHSDGILHDKASFQNGPDHVLKTDRITSRMSFEIRKICCDFQHPISSNWIHLIMYSISVSGLDSQIKWNPNQILKKWRFFRDLICKRNCQIVIWIGLDFWLKTYTSFKNNFRRNSWSCLK